MRRPKGRSSSPQDTVHKTRTRCLSNGRTNGGLPGRLARRRRRSRRHSLTVAELNVMKVALCTLLAVASNVGSTSSIGVTSASTRGTISSALDLGFLGTRPLISLDFLFRCELAMSEWTLVGLGTFSLGEFKAGPGTLRRNTRGRMFILTLTVALSTRFALTLAFAFSLDINLGRSNNVSSRNRGRALTIRVMSVVALGSFRQLPLFIH